MGAGRMILAVASLVLLTGCDLLTGKQDSVAREVTTKLNLLQIGIENTRGTEENARASVCVVAVVDSLALKPAVEGEEPDPALLEQQQRRERVVRQELNRRFVENKLMVVVQPDQASIDQARQEIITNNSAALSIPSAQKLGQALAAQVVVCALIDKEGAEVNIVAQLAADGTLVYQDTVMDWTIVVDAAKQEEAPAA